MANNTTESIYAVLGADPERASRFGHAMMVYGSKPEHSPAFITDHYDWASLGQANVVHVGGGGAGILPRPWRLVTPTSVLLFRTRSS